MPTPQDDDLIRDYIQHVAEVKERHEQGTRHPLTQTDLQTVALEMGLTPEDLARAQQQADQHLIQGQGYLRYGRWTEAIDELEQARCLNPLDLNVLQELARGYGGRFSVDQQERDRQQALSLAKQCLELQPGYLPALQLLHQLDRPRPRSQSFNLRRWTGWGGLLLLVLLGTSVVKQVKGSPETALAPAVQPAASPVAVTLVPTPELPRLVFDTRRSQLRQQGNTSVYTLQGLLVNQSNRELQRLRLKVDYLNVQDQVIASEVIDALGVQHVALRPGDRQPLGLDKALDASLHRVRLTVQSIESDVAPPQYPEPRPVELKGTARQASRIFSVAERRSQFQNLSAGRAYHDAVFEITNTGDAPIHVLKLQIDRYSSVGRILDRQSLLVVSEHDLPLLPGETRLKRSLTEIDASYNRYEVKVIDMK
jgi:tetratricopeptide (TPR) repeat protein